MKLALAIEATIIAVGLVWSFFAPPVRDWRDYLAYFGVFMVVANAAALLVGGLGLVWLWAV